MNILVIVSDTFRYDHLGYNGNGDITTPNLDALGANSVVFDRSYAASFPTMPMRADLFTGKWTFTYLGWAPLPREEAVLAQVLSDNGYQTMGVVDTPFFTRAGFGYDRGFSDFIWIRGQGWPETMRDVNLDRHYEEDYCPARTMRTAAQWLERHHRDSPFFLYVDAWDPHEYWDPPHWYVDPYYPGYDGRNVKPCYGPWKEQGVTAEDLEIAHACYCGEVTMVDKWIGFLLDRLSTLGLAEDTAVLFTTDHGFYFGEHGQFGKCVLDLSSLPFRWYRSPLYEEVCHTPLFVRIPGVEPRRTSGLVSAVDLMPTILELAEVEIPETVSGRSLVPMIQGKGASGREFVVTSPPLGNPGDATRAVDDMSRNLNEFSPATITTSEHALIYSAEGEPAELYNLVEDPNQQHDVIQDFPNVAQDLHAEFFSLLEGVGTEERFLKSRQRLSIGS